MQLTDNRRQDDEPQQDGRHDGRYQLYGDVPLLQSPVIRGTVVVREIEDVRARKKHEILRQQTGVVPEETPFRRHCGREAGRGGYDRRQLGHPV